MSTVVMNREDLIFDYNMRREDDMDMTALSELDGISLDQAKCCICNKSLTRDFIVTILEQTGDIFCLCKKHVTRVFALDKKIVRF